MASMYKNWGDVFGCQKIIADKLLTAGPTSMQEATDALESKASSGQDRRHVALEC